MNSAQLMKSPTLTSCFVLQDTIMATRQAQQALVPGRLVLLSDPATGLSELSVVLGEPQGYSSPSRTASATGLFLLDLYFSISNFIRVRNVMYSFHVKTAKLIIIWRPFDFQNVTGGDCKAQVCTRCGLLIHDH